jgi:sugar lactone lactonase YvrE
VAASTPPKARSPASSKFSPDGRPLLAWGDHGARPGGFGSYQLGTLKSSFGPIAVMVDCQDRVWVTSLNNRAQCFTPEGKLLMSIGSGKAPGQLLRPHGMATDSRGSLYVADAGNQRIQKFSVPIP